MKLRWLRSGSVSLRRHTEYLNTVNPVAAERLRRHISATVLRLCQFPQSGRTGQISGTRELVVTGWPYVVVYRVTADAVEILRVLHTSMDRPPGTMQ